MEKNNELNKEIERLRRQLAELRNLTIVLEEEKKNLEVKNDYSKTHIDILKMKKKI